MAEDIVAADPSMEEILASIRKIISDDAPPAVEAASAAGPAGEDVLELTQMVQDDGSVVDLDKPEPKPEPPPLPPEPVVPVKEPEPLPEPERLVSEPAEQSAAYALSSLANTVEIERLASSSSLPTSLGNGGRTLEDIVLELMRPLLKDWLDRNLPATVDRLVQKEIERIARRR